MTYAFFPSQIQIVIREWIWLDSLVIIQYESEATSQTKISAFPPYAVFAIRSMTDPINRV